MPDRKFSKLSLNELSRLLKTHYSDFDFLSELLAEVRYRTDFSAMTLQMALHTRIGELERETKQRSHKNTNDPKPGKYSKENNANPEIESLRRQLIQAHEQIANLQAQLKENVNSEEEQLFGHVGLNRNCPDFVIRSVRTTYRKALHPDGHPEGHKREAHRRFVDVEKTFEAIIKLRKL